MFDKHKRESLLLRDLLKKLIIIVIGSIVAAYGITLALYAGFGGATLAVLWQGIAETFHLSIGMASFVVAVGMILFALIYDKSQIHIGTVLYQIVYSTCVDVFATCHVYSTYRWFNFFIIAKKEARPQGALLSDMSINATTGNPPPPLSRGRGVLEGNTTRGKRLGYE